MDTILSDNVMIKAHLFVDPSSFTAPMLADLRTVFVADGADGVPNVRRVTSRGAETLTAQYRLMGCGGVAFCEGRDSKHHQVELL